MCTLDAIDFAILSELTGNARKTLKELSSRINLSAPAVATRIRKLESDSTIVGYHAVLDYEKLGYEITAVVHVALPPERRDAFRAVIREKPRVISCDQMTGDYSIMMRAVFRGRRELAEFLGEMEPFGKTRTQIVLASLQEPFGYASFEASL